MSRLTIVALGMSLLLSAELVSAQRVKQLGHAIVEFTSAEVKAVAAYGHEMLNGLLQNASVWRRPLSPYFATQLQPTIRFFSYPGRNVHNSFVTNPDEVASGDLFFKSTGGGWSAGTYRLVLSHPDAKAEMPIELD